MEEGIIDSWNVGYISPMGTKYTGKLTVTNKRLLYDVISDGAQTETSNEATFVKFGSDKFVVISKKSIKLILIEKGMFSSKLKLVMDNDEVHLFNAGKHQTDALIDAIGNDH